MPTRSIAIAFYLLLWISADTARSQSNPAPTPPTAPLGPKETLKTWNFDGKTAEQVLPWYQATTEDEKKLAHSSAVQAISTTRLSMAAKAKWGHEVETTITHLCQTETPEDDDKATITGTGDHATLKFDVPDLLPLFLVQNNGVWRVDMAAYARLLGAQLPSAIEFCDQSAVVCDKLTDAIIAGKYASGQDAIDAVKKALAALDTGQ